MNDKLLIETDFFSIYEKDGKLVSGHSDGVGYSGSDSEETWIKVRDKLNEHYQLTVFTEQEMKVLKDAVGRTYGEFDIFKEHNAKPSSMTDREWKEFLEKLS